MTAIIDLEKSPQTIAFYNQSSLGSHLWPPGLGNQLRARKVGADFLLPCEVMMSYMGG